jgi:fructokinase
MPDPRRPSAALYGAIETGGTKVDCSLTRGLDEVLASERFATTTPEDTFSRIIEFFNANEATHGRVAAFGMAAFGPLDLDPRSSGYGHLQATPKPGWSHYDLLAPLRERFAAPIQLDTDVNAAALAEWDHRAGSGLSSLVYVTVGTGIGAGAVMAGRALQGPWHPEMGHIRVPRHPRDQDFPGVCPFHRDCLEGLATGPAIVARYGRQMSEMLADEGAREIIASYLGVLAANITLMLVPECIVFGGGVMVGGALLPDIRRALSSLLAGYVQHALLAGSLEKFIVGPALGERSGIRGAMLLAAAAHRGIDACAG